MENYDIKQKKKELRAFNEASMYYIHTRKNNSVENLKEVNPPSMEKH